MSLNTPAARAERLTGRFRKLAEADPLHALHTRSSWSAEQAALVDAAALAEVWMRVLREHGPGAAFPLLSELSGAALARLDLSETCRRWRFWAAGPALNQALKLLPDAPLAFLDALSDEDVAWAWRVRASDGWEGMRELLKLPDALTQRIPDEDILYLWSDHAHLRPIESFAWLGQASPALAAKIPRTAIMRTVLGALQRTGDGRVLQALAALPEWAQAEVPEQAVQDAIAALEAEQPGSAADLLPQLPERFRAGMAPAVATESWRELARSDAASALDALALLDPRERTWARADEVRECWDRIRMGQGSGPALRAYQALPDDLRAAIHSADLATLFHPRPQGERGKELPRAAIQRLDLETLGAITAEDYARAWQIREQRRAGDGAILLQNVPPELLRCIHPAEVARSWQRYRQAERGRALLQLNDIPAPLRAEIPVGDVLETWRASVRSSPLGAVHEHSSLPEEYRAAIPEADVKYMYRLIGERNGAHALTSTNWPGDRLADVWAGAAEKQPALALDWARKQIAEVRDRIPLPLLHEVWRAALSQDPKEALAWVERVPRKLRPIIDRDTLAPLLQSTDAEVRLRAIALLGQVADAPESPPALPAPNAPQTRRT
jgi:hypothetical protein